MVARPSGRALAAALAALLAGACSGKRSAPAPAPGPAADDARAGGHRLVVLVVIDQLPRWGFDARRAHYQHGLARLLRDGTLYTAEYPYAETSTAPGHATLATGAPPAVTGVVANVWYRRELGRERLAEADDAAAILPIGDRPAGDAPGASSRALRVPGVADALRAATGGAGRSIAIAGKPRAACFALGKADLSLWYEPALVGFTSSRAYAPALPAWAVELDRAHPLAADLADVWEPLDAALLARATGIADAAPGEGGDYGASIDFPHALARTTDPARALRATPILDRAEVDAALAAVAGEQLGADDVADLLAVSFSAHDYVGHAWGQESWEMLDLELRLDRELGRLLDGLDRAVGAGRYAVVLTGDHGATRMIERSGVPVRASREERGGARSAPGGSARDEAAERASPPERIAIPRRIPPAELEAAGEAGAASVLGAGDWIAAISTGMVYVSAAFRARPADERARALAAIGRAIEAVPQVARVIALDELPAACDGLADLDARACRSRVSGETGEQLVVPLEGSIVAAGSTGTTHDSMSADNWLVPLVIVAPGRAPEPPAAAPVSILRVAPTLAALLGVPPPPAATAPPLVSPAPPLARAPR